jgi:hypothetical protein
LRYSEIRGFSFSILSFERKKERNDLLEKEGKVRKFPAKYQMKKFSPNPRADKGFDSPLARKRMCFFPDGSFIIEY